MEFVEPGNYLEFLGLKHKWENCKITADVRSKLTVFTHPRESIKKKSPPRIALRLR